MSVDDTIRELSRTLEKLGQLVLEINNQVGSIGSRINITLQTFDDSISGISKDANKITEQVDTTIGQIPGSWVFYLLLFTMIAVLVLLSALLLLNLIIKVRTIFRLMREDSSTRASTPTHPLVHSSEFSPSSKPFSSGPGTPPHISYPSREAMDTAKINRHIAVEMEHEPRRYGFSSHSQQGGRMSSGGGGTSPSVFHQPKHQSGGGGELFYPNGGTSGGFAGGGTFTPACDLRGRQCGFGSSSSGGGAGSPRSHQV